MTAQNKQPNNKENPDIGALNASANGVVNAIAGMGAIAARIEAAVKTIHSEREKAVANIRQERSAAVDAIKAAATNSGRSNLDRPLVPLSGGGHKPFPD